MCSDWVLSVAVVFLPCTSIFHRDTLDNPFLGNWYLEHGMITECWDCHFNNVMTGMILLDIDVERTPTRISH